MLLRDAVDRYLIALRTSKPSPHTFRAYHSDLLAVINILSRQRETPIERLPVDVVNTLSMEAAFADYADAHGKATVKRCWSTWNQLCNHMVASHSIPGNPMAAVKPPKVSRGAPHSFSDEHIQRLLIVLRDGTIPSRKPWPLRDYALISTLLVTGLRTAEVLSLTLGTITGPRGQRQVGVRGKGDKYRVVPIDARLEPLLDAYLYDRWQRFPPVDGIPKNMDSDLWGCQPPTTPLWLSDAGKPLTVGQLEHLVRRAYRAAGIESHRPPGALTHACRHTFAQGLVENGVSTVEVMTLLGHASLQTTQRYVSARPHYLRDAVAANPVYRQLPHVAQGDHADT